MGRIVMGELQSRQDHKVLTIFPLDGRLWVQGGKHFNNLSRQRACGVNTEGIAVLHTGLPGVTMLLRWYQCRRAFWDFTSYVYGPELNSVVTGKSPQALISSAQ
jgi:hypothetical protein